MFLRIEKQHLVTMQLTSLLIVLKAKDADCSRRGISSGSCSRNNSSGIENTSVWALLEAAIVLVYRGGTYQSVIANRNNAKK